VSWHGHDDHPVERRLRDFVARGQRAQRAVDEQLQPRRTVRVVTDSETHTQLEVDDPRQIFAGLLAVMQQYPDRPVGVFLFPSDVDDAWCADFSQRAGRWLDKRQLPPAPA
jgi:hypothetical protein